MKIEGIKKINKEENDSEQNGYDLLSKNKHNSEDLSSEFEDECKFKSITMNEKGKNNTRWRKNTPKFKANIRWLEIIYNNGERYDKVSFK